MTKYTAEQYREMANGCKRDRRVSQGQSDTDGFLSQWASGEMSSRYLRAAEWVENGEKLEFDALFFGDVEVEAKLIHSKFNQYQRVFVVSDEWEQKFGRKFIPQGKKSRVQKQLGLREKRIMAKAAYSTRTGKAWRI
jgi:hypothetical protein